MLISIGYGHNSDLEREFLCQDLKNKVELYESSINLKLLLVSLAKSLLFFIRDDRAFPLYRIKCLLKYFQTLKTRNLFFFTLKVIPALNVASRNEISIIDILKRVEDSKKTFLKMDIEGGEYACLNSILMTSQLKEMNGLVIEFHEIPKRIDSFYSILSSLRDNFFVSNIHINNFEDNVGHIPKVIEITFINRRFVKGQVDFVDFIPHELDSPCNPNKPEISYIYR